MTRLLLQLEDLTCPTCVRKIEDNLLESQGVEKVKLLFNSNKAKVNFNPKVISADQIKAKVEELGYKVQSFKIAS